MPRATSRSTIYVQPRPIEHLLIEVQLVLQELQGHRTSPLLDVAHSVPRLRSIREKTRYVKVDAGEMLHDPSVAQSQLTIHLVEDVLLSSGDDSSAMLPVEGERHVDAVQRHPVNLTLPALPLPVRVAVAERADVHVVAVLSQDLGLTATPFAHLLLPLARHARERHGHGDVVSRSVFSPRDGRVAVILHVPRITRMLGPHM